MKKVIGILMFLVTVSCSKNAPMEEGFSKESIEPKYDTLAVDSFSTGATSVDVARKIRISSLAYQDSLRDIRVKLEQDKILKKETDEKLKAEKSLEEAKKKTEDLKKEKKKTEGDISPAQNPITP